MRPAGPGKMRVESTLGEAYCCSEEALLFLLALVQNRLLRSVRSCFAIHGAAVARAGNGVVLAAASGAGKSTLALELLRRGARVLSDEVAALDRSDGLIYPFPRAMALRPDTPEWVPLPELEKSVSMEIAGETRIVVEGASGLDAPVPLRHLILLTAPSDHSLALKDGQVCLELFGPALPESFIERLQSCPPIFEVERISGRMDPGIRVVHDVESPIVSLIDEAAFSTGTRCHELISGRLGETADLIEQMGD